MRHAASIVLAAPFAAATALAQDVRPATDPWQPLDPAFGLGVASCNTDEETGNYWCFAVRCGDGGTLEFVHLFAGGDPMPEGTVVVDGDEHPVDFAVVRPFEEHAAALTPDAPLLRALKSGREAEYVSLESMTFPIDLSGAEAGISAVEAQCR